MKPIQAKGIPSANGHYSQAIAHGNLLFISGQLPIDPDTGDIPEGIVTQTRATLDKLDVILRAAGAKRSDLIQVRIYISNIEDWDAVDRVYREFMGLHKPVRAIVPVGKLHFGCQIEIEAQAALSAEPRD